MNIKKDDLKIILDILLILIAIFSFALFITILGFEIDNKYIPIIDFVLKVIIILFIIQELTRWLLITNIKQYLKIRWFENIVAFSLMIDLFIPEFEIINLFLLIPNIDYKTAKLLYLGLIHFIIVFVVIIKILRYNYIILKLKLPPGAIFSLSFAAIILFGTSLLLLPRSTTMQSISFIDSLFTSTSAVCVTGLVVLDTAKDFTILGQIIILFLIQIGGLGVMTFTTFFAFYLSGSVSFKYKVLMKDLLSQDSLSEIKSLLLDIITYTLIIELLGAFLLYISNGGNFDNFDIQLMYQSVFHSISAFCNAGFSIFSGGMTNNALSGNYFYHTIILSLIVIGGLGFNTLSNIKQIRPWKKYIKLRHRLNVNTKLILTTTLTLIIGGTFLITVFENYKFDITLNFGEKLFHSLYLSITTRTAGFNILPMSSINTVTMIVLLPLMWIGASPGSTGGGIKTTTISLALITLFNQMRGKEKCEIFEREISQNTINNAFMVIFASIIFLCISIILLVWAEPDKQPVHLIFEAVSAISTVGLSIDLTPHLGTGGKIIIIFLMFIGRIGVLTFFLSFVRQGKSLNYSLPQTKIMVG